MLSVQDVDMEDDDEDRCIKPLVIDTSTAPVGESHHVDATESQAGCEAGQSADHIPDQASYTASTPPASTERSTTSQSSPAAGRHGGSDDEEDDGVEADESGASSDSQSSTVGSSPSKDLLLTGSGGSGADLSPGSAGGTTPRGSKSRRKADRVRTTA